MFTHHFPALQVLIAMALLTVVSEGLTQENNSGASENRSVVPTRTRPVDLEPQPPTEMLAANFQATFYEVQAAADRVGALDAKALARQAATPEALLKVLAETGNARILYRIDQPVNVYSERITVGSREPVVVGTRKTNTGQAINMISYQNVGVIVRLSAQKPLSEADHPEPNVSMSVELAALAHSDIEMAPGQKAVTTRTVSIEHSEPLEFGRPLVMLAVSSASSAEQTTPTVYVIRYFFSPPVGK